jgi:hypothetical protein
MTYMDVGNTEVILPSAKGVPDNIDAGRGRD